LDVITVKDEELHLPGESPHWQESFYFNWSDPDRGEFGLTRIGLNHASGTADAVLITLRDGKPEFVYAEVGVPFTQDPLDHSVGDGLTIGRLTYTQLAPLERWQVTLTGADSLELEWTAYTPVVDFHQGFLGDAERAQEHFEQSGRVTGRVSLAGVTRTVDGLGQRDKSWGVRDWNGLTGWDWIAGQFDETLSFNATRTQVGGRQEPVGFVFDNGEVEQVTDVQIAYEWATEHQPDTARIDVVVASGRTYTFRAKGYGRVPLLKNGLFIEETPCTFEADVDGVTRTGVGVLEHAYHVSNLGVLKRLPRLLPIRSLAKKGSK